MSRPVFRILSASYRLSRGLVLLAALFAAFPSHALPIVSLSTSATSVNVGDSIVLSIEVSGLGPAEAIGGYDVVVSFDTTRLSFDSAAFQGFLGASSSNGFAVVAGARALEVSFVDSATLVATQPAAGVLVNVVLDAIGVGNVSIGFVTVSSSVVDQDANPLAVTYQALASPIAIVPEPGTAALLGGGLLLMLGVARRRC